MLPTRALTQARSASDGTVPRSPTLRVGSERLPRLGESGYEGRSPVARLSESGRSASPDSESRATRDAAPATGRPRRWRSGLGSDRHDLSCLDRLALLVTEHQ